MSLMTRFEQGAVRLGFLIEQVFSSKVQYSSACILVEGGGGGGCVVPYFVVHELLAKYQSAKAIPTNCCTRKTYKTASLF